MDRWERQINSKTSSNHRLTTSSRNDCSHLMRARKSDIINNNSASMHPVEIDWGRWGSQLEFPAELLSVDEHSASCSHCRHFYIMGKKGGKSVGNGSHLAVLKAQYFNTLSCLHFLPLSQSQGTAWPRTGVSEDAWHKYFSLKQGAPSQWAQTAHGSLPSKFTLYKASMKKVSWHP